MKVFWFDTETSGLDEKSHGIIQLAFQIEIDGSIVEESVLFGNCEGRAIEDSALAVNGYTREQISAFPYPSEMYKSLSDAFGRHVDRFDSNDKFYAGGFNVDFDLRFLRDLWDQCGDRYFGSWFHFPKVDPVALLPALQYSGKCLDYLGRMRLTDMSSYFGVGTDGAHDAVADIGMTRRLAIAMVERFSE